MGVATLGEPTGCDMRRREGWERGLHRSPH